MSLLQYILKLFLIISSFNRLCVCLYVYTDFYLFLDTNVLWFKLSSSAKYFNSQFSYAGSFQLKVIFFFLCTWTEIKIHTSFVVIIYKKNCYNLFLIFLFFILPVLYCSVHFLFLFTIQTHLCELVVYFNFPWLNKNILIHCHAIVNFHTR